MKMATKNFRDQAKKELRHIPIMPETVTSFLIHKVDGIYLDATFGGGGHSHYFLERFPEIQLYAVDRDPNVAVHASDVSIEYAPRFHFGNKRFSQIDTLAPLKFDGIFFDFGISSLQLDDEERGFSFRYHSPLDMRMNDQEGMSAYEFLRTASREELVTAIRDWGEEIHWRKIVDVILKDRLNLALRFTDTFAALIEKIVPQRRFSHIHSATKTFQGLRIAINNELEEIREALPKAFTLLNPNGRLVVLSFHSLEDRIVKQFFRNCVANKQINEGSGDDSYDFYNKKNFLGKILTKKPIRPDSLEIERNPRSRSAKLRVLEKF